MIRNSTTRQRQIVRDAIIGIVGLTMVIWALTAARAAPTFAPVRSSVARDGGLVARDTRRAVCEGFLRFTRVPADTLDATPSSSLTDTIVLRYGMVQRTGGPACFTWEVDPANFRFTRNGSDPGVTITQT